MQNNKEHKEEFELAIIGNIVAENLYGQEQELRFGTKHFSSNTKVICLPEYGGMGHERMPVLGIHKKSKRLIKVVIWTKQITNIRVKKIYKPNLIAYIKENFYYQQWQQEDNYESKLSAFADQLAKYSES